MKKRKDNLNIQINFVIKSLFFISIFLILLALVLVVIPIMGEFTPDEIMVLDISQPASHTQPTQPFSAIIWNIGYAGLGAEADFFIEGGLMSKGESEATIQRHLDNILNFLKQESPNFLILQEVDISGSRSFDINQLEAIKNSFPNYFSSFAFNYKVLYVPIPISDPMGTVNSGLFSLSNLKITGATRFGIASVENFPDKYFHLKRAVLLHHIELNSKNISIFNIHLSAFAGQGIRDKQLFVLKQLMLDEKAKGNAVIVAGDWNMELPGTPDFETTEPYPEFLGEFPSEWIPEGFSLISNSLIPTVRTNEQPYTEGKNFRTIIDYFLVSDDIKVLSSKTFDLGFLDSDHNPVKIEFEII